MFIPIFLATRRLGRARGGYVPSKPPEPESEPIDPRFPGRSRLLKSFPECSSLATVAQIEHFARYRYFYMHIEYKGQSYRLVDEFNLQGKYGPWKTGGEMSNIRDYCTDGREIYEVKPFKPKGCELLKEPGETNGTFDLGKNRYYIRMPKEHILTWGSQTETKPIGCKIKIGSLEAEPDGKVVFWLEER